MRCNFPFFAICWVLISSSSAAIGSELKYVGRAELGYAHEKVLNEPLGLFQGVPQTIDIEVSELPPRSMVEIYQTAWSTIFSAIFGFGGLIVATAMGLRQTRKAQKTQSELDRKAQEDHWAQERERQFREWRENQNVENRQRDTAARSLATALAAELSVVQLKLESFSESAEKIASSQDKFIEENANAGQEPQEYLVSWEAPCSVFNANLGKLDLLPFQLAKDAIWIFGNVQKESASQLDFVHAVPILVRSNKVLADKMIKFVEGVKTRLESFATNNETEPELLINISGE